MSLTTKSHVLRRPFWSLAAFSKKHPLFLTWNRTHSFSLSGQRHVSSVLFQKANDGSVATPKDQGTSKSQEERERLRDSLNASFQKRDLNGVCQTLVQCAVEESIGGPKLVPDWAMSTVVRDNSMEAFTFLLSIGRNLSSQNIFFHPTYSIPLIVRASGRLRNAPESCRFFEDLVVKYCNHPKARKNSAFKSKDALKSLFQASVLSADVNSLKYVQTVAAKAHLRIDNSWLTDSTRSYLAKRSATGRLNWKALLTELTACGIDLTFSHQHSNTAAAAAPTSEDADDDWIFSILTQPTSPSPQTAQLYTKTKTQDEQEKRYERAMELLGDAETLSEALDIYFREISSPDIDVSLRDDCYDIIFSKFVLDGLEPDKKEKKQDVFEGSLELKERATNFAVGLARHALKEGEELMAWRVAIQCPRLLGAQRASHFASPMISHVAKIEDIKTASNFYQRTFGEYFVRPNVRASADMLIAANESGARDDTANLFRWVYMASFVPPPTSAASRLGYLESIGNLLIAESQFSTFVSFFSALATKILEDSRTFPTNIFSQLPHFCYSQEGASLIPIFYKNLSKSKLALPTMHHHFAHAATRTGQWSLFKKVLSDYKKLKTAPPAAAAKPETQTQTPTTEQLETPPTLSLNPQDLPIHLLFPEKHAQPTTTTATTSPPPAVRLPPTPFTGASEPFDQKAMVKTLLDVTTTCNEASLPFLSILLGQVFATPTRDEISDLVKSSIREIYNQSIAASFSSASAGSESNQKLLSVLGKPDRIGKSLNIRNCAGYMVWDSSSILQCPSPFPMGMSLSSPDTAHVVPWTCLNEVLSLVGTVQGAREIMQQIVAGIAQGTVIVPSMPEMAEIGKQNLEGLSQETMRDISTVDQSVIQVADWIRAHLPEHRKALPVWVVAEDTMLRSAAAMLGVPTMRVPRSQKPVEKKQTQKRRQEGQDGLQNQNRAENPQQSRFSGKPILRS